MHTSYESSALRTSCTSSSGGSGSSPRTPALSARLGSSDSFENQSSCVFNSQANKQKLSNEIQVDFPDLKTELKESQELLDVTVLFHLLFSGLEFSME